MNHQVSVPYDSNDPSPCENCKALSDWSARQWMKLGYYCPKCGYKVPDPIVGQNEGCVNCGYGRKE